VIVLTLDTEWLEICLCKLATSLSLNDRLHLKHFQDSTDMGIITHNLLIRILNDLSKILQNIDQDLELVKFLDIKSSFYKFFMVTKIQGFRSKIIMIK